MIASKAVVLARSPTLASTGAAPTLRLGHWAPSAPALLTVANRPLLAHALDWLDVGGIRQVAVVTSHRLADETRQVLSGGDWRFEREFVTHGAGEAFGQTLAGLDSFLDGEPFVLHLADSLARRPLRDLLDVAEPQDLGSLVVVQGDQPGTADVVDITDRRRNGRWATPPELTSGAPGGVALLRCPASCLPRELDAWPGREIEALVSHLGALGGEVRVRKVDGWWRYRPGPDALLEGNRFALEEIEESPPLGEIIDTRVQGAVDIHPTARLESSVVRGPVIIGAGVRLRDAYVGPYTSIGPDVVIEGSEIEHSIVMREASIRHLGGRLEASIVGPQARVFRDFRLPRAVRLSVGQGAEVSLP